MTRLKCWKRILNNKTGVVYKNVNKNKHYLDIYKVGKLGEKQYWFVDLSTPSIGKGLKTNNKNKTQALKFANSYMKKHDKC